MVVAKGHEPRGVVEVRGAVVGLGDHLHGEVVVDREGGRGGYGGRGFRGAVHLREMVRGVRGHAQDLRALVVVVDRVFHREDHGRDQGDRDVLLSGIHQTDQRLQPSDRRMRQHARSPRGEEVRHAVGRTWLGCLGLEDWR